MITLETLVAELQQAPPEHLEEVYRVLHELRVENLLLIEFAVTPLAHEGVGGGVVQDIQETLDSPTSSPLKPGGSKVSELQLFAASLLTARVVAV